MRKTIKVIAWEGYYESPVVGQYEIGYGGFDWFDPELVSDEGLNMIFETEVDNWEGELIHIYLVDVEVPNENLDDVTTWLDEYLWEVEYSSLSVIREFRAIPEIGVR